VYRAAWRGKTVAVKLVHVPKSSGELLHGWGDKGVGKAVADQLREESNYSQDKAERMALIEAVVSMSMQHPNIVRVFRYEVHPLAGDALGTGVGAVGKGLRPGRRPATGAAEQEQLEDDSLGWELRLVMEYCSQGTLRSALDRGVFCQPSSSSSQGSHLPNHYVGGGSWSAEAQDLSLVLPVALDVARAMLHLHSEGLLHGDLKASNVLLDKGPAFDMSGAAGSMQQQQQPQQQPRAGTRLIGKISDFGLSLMLDADATHVSHMHGGTVTHMSPELLLHGRASRSSDVYAFGVLLWEMVTGRRAFQGYPLALLVHRVAHQGARPQWPLSAAVPARLKTLVEDCWKQEASERPAFGPIVLELQQLRADLPQILASPTAFQSEQQPPHEADLAGYQALGFISGPEEPMPLTGSLSMDFGGGPTPAQPLQLGGGQPDV